MTIKHRRPTPTPTPMTAALQRTVNYIELTLLMATAPNVMPRRTAGLCDAMQMQGVPEPAIITALLHLVIEALAGGSHAGEPPLNEGRARVHPLTGIPCIPGGHGDVY